MKIVHEKPSRQFQNKSFTQPNKSVRPQRQLDSSTVERLSGRQRENVQHIDKATDNEEDSAAYYPQSSAWEISKLTEESTLQTVQQPPTTSLPRIEEITTSVSRVKEIEDPKVTMVDTESLKDTSELRALVTQLSKTLELLKVQNQQKRLKQSQKQVEKVTDQIEEITEDEPEIIYVNIWNKVDGELKLSGQKPMLKDTFDEMHKKKDFSSLVRPQERPVNTFNPKQIHPQGGVGNPSLAKPMTTNERKQIKSTGPYYERKSSTDTLIRGDPGFEQFVNRQASFLLNSGAKLDLPPSLIGLLPSTVKPLRDIQTRKQTHWPLPQVQNSNRPAPSFRIQGVGADFAQPSFADAQATQNKQDFERFLQNPLIRERPFNQLERTTKPPNFTPIPIPEVLRPSKLNRLPSGLESALAATTEKPLMVPFEAKYGLKPPSQLYGWFSEMFQPVNDQVQTVQSSFRSPSQVKVPTVLDLYGNYGQTKAVQQNEPNKKIIALEEWFS